MSFSRPAVGRTGVHPVVRGHLDALCFWCVGALCIYIYLPLANSLTPRIFLIRFVYVRVCCLLHIVWLRLRVSVSLNQGWRQIVRQGRGDLFWALSIGPAVWPGTSSVLGDLSVSCRDVFHLTCLDQRSPTSLVPIRLLMWFVEDMLLFAFYGNP